MKAKTLIVDQKEESLLITKELVETFMDLECDTATQMDDKKIRDNNYDLIFVHLSIYDKLENPTTTIRKYQKKAFIVGVGGELKSWYQRIGGLEGCDDFYGKTNPHKYFENLLNEIGGNGR